jgi:hypothetical protein
MKRREVKFVAGSLQLAPDRIEGASRPRKAPLSLARAVTPPTQMSRCECLADLDVGGTSRGCAIFRNERERIPARRMATHGGLQGMESP